MLERTRRETYDWGGMEWLAEGADKKVSLARMTVLPGKSSPAHYHENCNEVIHVLSGKVVQRCRDNWFDMRTDDTFTVPAGQTHLTRNNGCEIAVLMLAYSDGDRNYVEVMDK